MWGWGGEDGRCVCRYGLSGCHQGPDAVCLNKGEAKAHPWVACHTACGAEGWVHSVRGQNYNFSSSSANHRLLPPYAWLPMSESSSGQGEGHRGRVEGRAPPGLVLRLVYVAAQPSGSPVVSMCIGFLGPVCSARSLFGTPSLEGMLCLSFHLHPIGRHLVVWSQLAARKSGSGFFPDSGHLLSRKFNSHERRGKGDTS